MVALLIQRSWSWNGFYGGRGRGLRWRVGGMQPPSSKGVMGELHPWEAVGAFSREGWLAWGTTEARESAQP